MPSINLISIFANESSLEKASLIVIDNLGDYIFETVCNSFCRYFVVTVQKGIAPVIWLDVVHKLLFIKILYKLYKHREN